MLGLVAAALLVVAGGSYWLGTRTSDESESASDVSPGATLSLPEARPPKPEAAPPTASPEVARAAEQEVRPERTPTVARPAWKPLPRTVPQAVADRVQRVMATDEMDKIADAQQTAAAARVQQSKPPALVVPNTQNVKLWPARESAGATGRVVQIGAFGTRLQAKLGWRYMSHAYPGVKRLPAVVVETRNSRGRPFYRFQIGTTSQAHSEVLCQRMQRIRFSCAVVGLPGAKRAVER
jgi:hypothetical protein